MKSGRHDLVAFGTDGEDVDVLGIFELEAVFFLDCGKFQFWDFSIRGRNQDSLAVCDLLIPCRATLFK